MVPIPWVPNLQVQGHIPTSKTCMGNPEDGTPCDRDRFLKRTSVLISLLGFAIPADLIAISLLGESAPLTSCSVQVAICPEDEREEGEPIRD